MRVGSLVMVRTSSLSKNYGKLAIVVETYACNAKIYIIEFQKAVTYELRKLEVICE